MIITTQTWMLYPDDAKQLKEDLQDNGIAVNFQKSDQKWHIGKFKHNFAINHKPLILNKGPFAGVRCETVVCHDVLQITPILQKCGWFVTQLSKADQQLAFFIGKKDKKQVYKMRLERSK